MGFYYDHETFTLAQARFADLGRSAPDGQYSASRWISEFSPGSGLLDVLQLVHSRARDQVLVSVNASGGMLTHLGAQIGRTAATYDAAEDKTGADVRAAWPEEQRDRYVPGGGPIGLPHGKFVAPDLERLYPGLRKFRHDVPPDAVTEDVDFPISAVINRIIDLDLMPADPPTDPQARAVWDYVWDKVGLGDIVEAIPRAVLGDWEQWALCGSAMIGIGHYWLALKDIVGEDAGTFFLGWDGAASDSAERVFQTACDLYSDSALSVIHLGNAYIEHARACYLVFSELEGCLGLLGDGLALLCSVLNARHAANPIDLPARIGACLDVIMTVENAAGDVISRLLLIPRILRAAVAAIELAASTLAGYSNKMWLFADDM